MQFPYPAREANPTSATLLARPTRAFVFAVLALSILPAAFDAAGATETVATLPSARYGTSAVWDGTDAYVFGGHDARNPGTRFDDIVRYDPQTNVATVLAAALPSGRYAASVVWTGTDAYLFGGQGATLLDEIVRYNPQTGTVSVMTAKLPTGRAFTSAVWDGTHAYVFGGLDSTFAFTDEIVQYDPATDTVTVMATALPTARSGTSAVWDGGSAIVFGGFDGWDHLDEIVRYTPGTGAVAVLGATLPTPREFMAAVWTGSEAQLIGGRKPSHLDEIVRFSPASGAVTVRTATLPTGRYEASAVWDGARAYVFGGIGSPRALDDIVQVGGDPPSAPRNLVAAPDLGMNRLAWAPPETSGDAPVTAYRVYRGTSGAADALLAELPGDALSYADASCRLREECTYGVLAVNVHGASRLSNLVTATGLQPCVPYEGGAATNACLSTQGEGTFARPTVDVTDPAIDPNGGLCLLGNVCAPGVDGVVVGTRREPTPYGASGYVEATAACARAPGLCRATLP